MHLTEVNNLPRLKLSIRLIQISFKIELLFVFQTDPIQNLSKMRIVPIEKSIFISQYFEVCASERVSTFKSPIYCEQSPNEISVQVQSPYCNDNLSSNHRHIYVKSEQVKQREELERKREREREREKSFIRFNTEEVLHCLF